MAEHELEHLTELEDYQKRINSGRFVVIDFYTQWCGPCKALAPRFAELSKEYAEHVDFYKVDVDEAEEIGDNVGIRSIPTIQFYRNGITLHEQKGANADAIEQTILELLETEAAVIEAEADVIEAEVETAEGNDDE